MPSVQHARPVATPSNVVVPTVGGPDSDPPAEGPRRDTGMRPRSTPGAIAPDMSGTILVVDDDRLGAKVTSETLEALGHRVLVAPTAGSALEQMNDEVDVILMDVEMPSLDGPRLLPLLRRRCTGFVPCVFLTGHDDDGARHRCLDAGGDDFLSKPTRRIELEMRMSSMLRIRRLTQELARRATVDPLTGVQNRAALEATLGAREHEHRRYTRPLSILIADIDFFKRVNDQHGHAAGDEVIRRFGEVLRAGTRTADGVYRYGGEEFVIVAPETGPEGAVVLGERLARAFREATKLSPYGPQTVSMGIASSVLDVDHRSPRELLVAADRALYQAKESGRNRVVLEGTPVSRPVDSRPDTVQWRRR